MLTADGRVPPSGHATVAPCVPEPAFNVPNPLGAIATGVRPLPSTAMATEPDADGRIELPSDFAEHLATVGNLESPPETLAECLSRFADRLEASGETIGADDLYATEPTRHEVHVDGRVRYSPCVLDALSAAVMEPTDPVTVRSVDPESGKPVTFSVVDGAVDVSPAAAVISFGIAATIPALQSSGEPVFSWVLQGDDDDVRAAFCRFTNAFESRASYDRWADGTEAVAVPVRPQAAVALIRQYVARD